MRVSPPSVVCSEVYYVSPNERFAALLKLSYRTSPCGAATMAEHDPASDRFTVSWLSFLSFAVSRSEIVKPWRVDGEQWEDGQN